MEYIYNENSFFVIITIVIHIFLLKPLDIKKEKAFPNFCCVCVD